jgi:hypothetical protein
VKLLRMEPTKSPIDKYLYRYDYMKAFGEPVKLVLWKYPVLRETPKGYWIERSWGHEKWVAAGGGGFAQETELAALKRYIRRKQTHRQILGTRYDELAIVIQMAEQKLRELEEEG